MHPATSLSPGRYLTLAWKVSALMVALVLMSSSWAVAAVCHGCDGGGGGGGGGTGCGTLGSATTFGQEPRISGSPKVGSSSSFSKTSANPTPNNVDIALTSWHVGSTSTWNSSYASVGTAATYTPSSADQGKYLFAKFGVSRAVPFCEEVWVTDAKPIAIGDAPVVSVLPMITGSTNAGSTLSVTNGAWAPEPQSYTRQWLRNGTAITGATASNYALTEQDRGMTISVRVTVARAGHQSGTAMTGGVAIPKTATTIAVTGLSSSSRFGVAKTGMITVTAASGVPAGAVEVRHGATVLHRANLVNGKAAMTLSKSLAARAYTLTFAYIPATGSLHASSTQVQAHTVKKARTKTSYRWRKKPTHKKAGMIRVYVTSPDAGKVTAGKVKIRVSKKTYTKSVKNGYVDIKIGKLKKGKRAFVRSYLGGTSFEKATSRKFTLRVK